MDLLSGHVTLQEQENLLARVVRRRVGDNHRVTRKTALDKHIANLQRAYILDRQKLSNQRPGVGILKHDV